MRISILLVLLVVTGCASKFAPVVSRPDNLIIDCPTGCKFNIPMNTEIIVARNTNGYDAAKAFFGHIPFLGSLALGWKSMDVAENIAETAIDSFNRFSDSRGSPSSVVNNTTTNTTGDTITSGDIISTETDSSGSGNSSSADVAETHQAGDETHINIDGDGVVGGGSITKNPVEYNTTYSNAYNTTDAGYCNGNGCFAPTPSPSP